MSSNKADISLSKLQDEVERMCEDREEGELDEGRSEPDPPAAQSSPVRGISRIGGSRNPGMTTSRGAGRTAARRSNETWRPF